MTIVLLLLLLLSADVVVVLIAMVCRLQPVSEWTTRNVLEWMASVNMISYSGPFESTAIQGSDLPGLDRHKLAGMGIKEDYPQQAILVCISELCRTRGIVSTLPISTHHHHSLVDRSHQREFRLVVFRRKLFDLEFDYQIRLYLSRPIC